MFFSPHSAHTHRSDITWQGIKLENIIQDLEQEKLENIKHNLARQRTLDPLENNPFLNLTRESEEENILQNLI